MMMLSALVIFIGLLTIAYAIARLAEVIEDFEIKQDDKKEI